MTEAREEMETDDTEVPGNEALQLSGKQEAGAGVVALYQQTSVSVFRISPNTSCSHSC